MSGNRTGAERLDGSLPHDELCEPLAATWKRPREISSYDILKELACGGQAMVYKASHKRTKAEVALKVLYLGPAFSDKARHQFDREIDLVAHLDHPYIVKVHDKGAFEHGYYFAMDYVQGKPLDEYVTSNKLSFRDKMRLFREVCDGVAHAHHQGVMHRDLKPPNILVDERGNPHILDFGCAKAAGSLGSGVASMASLSIEIKGTPAYMSPEQAAGRRVDVRSDVYTLGVVFYRILTGQFPYGVSGGIDSIMENVRSAEPVRPRAICRGFDPDVEAILLKCIEKDADRRYHSAADLRDEIERWLQGLAIHAKSGLPYILWKWAERHRYTVTIVGLLAAIVAGFVLVLLHLYIEKGKELDKVRSANQKIQALHEQIGDNVPQIAFLHFLEAWHRKDPGTMKTMMAALTLGNAGRERRGLAYLTREDRWDLDESPFRESFAENDRWFADFVIAESYYRRKNLRCARMRYADALRAAEQTQAVTATGDELYVKTIRARLYELSP